jgi:hypothetical protein
MRLAFTSTRHAVAFGLLLLLVVISPILVGKNLLPPRAEAYSIQNWKKGSFPWIHHQIFEDTNDFDMVFIGSSHMLWGIDTPYIEQKLEEQLGHKAAVNTLGWAGAGYEALYFIAKDLLERHQVKVMVIYDEAAGLHSFEPTPFWFRYGDDAQDLSGLPWRERTRLYSAAVVGIPRNLLNLCRASRPADLAATNCIQSTYHSPNPASQLGAVSGRMAFGYDLNTYIPLIEFAPTNGVLASDVCIYSELTRSNFIFSEEAWPEVDRIFATRLVELVQSHGCKLVLLHLPMRTEAHQRGIQENHFWRESKQAGVSILGVPPEIFFAGLSETQCDQLYSDPGHLSQNGQRYFTALITPALLKLYAEATTF